MYSFINFIPLIFGNHQTIEFRIHTPTYDANKIIDFLMLNTFLIDYAATNSKNILLGTDRLMDRNNLHIFIEQYVSQNKMDGYRAIYDELTHYIHDRRQATEGLTRENGVSYTESEIRTSKYMKFNTYQFRKKSKSPFSEEDVQLEENPFRSNASERDRMNEYLRQKGAEMRARMQIEELRAAVPVLRSPANPNRKERRATKAVEARANRYDGAEVTNGTTTHQSIKFDDAMYWHDSIDISPLFSTGKTSTLGLDTANENPAKEIQDVGVSVNSTTAAGMASFSDQELERMSKILTGELEKEATELKFHWTEEFYKDLKTNL